MLNSGISPRSIHQLAGILAVVSGLGFLTIYLGFPNPWTEHSLGPLYSKILGKSAVLSLIGLVMTLCLTCFWILFSSTDHSGFRPIGLALDSSTSKPLWIFVLLVCGFLFIREIRDVIVRPLELNEFCELSRIRLGHYVGHGWARILGLGHPLSLALSWGSMSAFGYDRIPARLPVFLVSAGFLATLAWMLKTGFSRFVVLVTLLHIALNPLVRWQMNSMRGYMAALCFSLLLLWGILQWVRSPTNARARKTLPWLFVFPVFCNLFSGLFSVCAFLALLYWAYREIANSSPEERKAISSTVLYCALGLIVVIGMLLHQARTISIMPATNVNPENIRASFGYLGALFGLRSYPDLWIKVLTLGFLFAILFHSRAKKPELRFLGTLLGVGIVLLSTLMPLFGFALEERHLIEWLIPLVLWLALTAEGIENQILRRLTQGLVVLGLVVGPLVTRLPATHYVGIFPGFEEFVHQVQKELSKTSKPCLSMSKGNKTQDFYLDWYSREVYFWDEFKRAKTECTAQYHLTFGLDKKAPGNTEGLELIEQQPSLQGAFYRGG